MTVTIGAIRERVDAADAGGAPGDVAVAAGEGEACVFMSCFRTACVAV
jgi:hypothetical protein